MVVRAESVMSEDHVRGERYTVDEFDIINVKHDRAWGPLINPKVTGYYFKDGSMQGAGIGLSRDQVQVVGTAKFQEKVTVEYVFKSVRIA